MSFKTFYNNYVTNTNMDIDFTNMVKKCDDEKVIRNNDLENFFEIVILTNNCSHFVDIFKNIKKRLGIVPNVMKYFLNEPHKELKRKILNDNCKLLDNYISEFLSSESWEQRDSAIILATILSEFVNKIPYQKIVDMIKFDRSEYVRAAAVDYAKENYITLLIEDIWLFIPNEWNSVVRRSLLKVLVELPSKELENNKKEKHIMSIKNNLPTLDVYNDDDDSWIIENLKKLNILYKRQTEMNCDQSIFNIKNNIDKNSLLEIILLECQNKEELQDKECYGD
uniref:BACK domain-containing protein n=1 Tax=Strongyloides stercoralis TaxID=6248 RepID=A0A0K0EQS7_STRER